jgi:hypothetical protein
MADPKQGGVLAQGLAFGGSATPPAAGTCPKRRTPLTGCVADIEDLTEAYMDFRHVLCTGHTLQLVLMALMPVRRSARKPMPGMTCSFASNRAGERS